MVTFTDRAKVRDDSRSSGTTWSYYSAGNHTYTYYPKEFVTLIDTAETIGQDLVNYHKLRREGALLPHTGFYQLEHFATLNGSMNEHITSGTGWEGDLWTDPMYFTADDILSAAGELELDQLVTGAAASIYSQGFDGLTFLAELPDVKRLFLGLGKKLKRMQLELKKSKRRNYKGLWSEYNSTHSFTDILDDIGSLWLEGRYGWRPLVADVKNIVELVKTIDEKRERFSQRVGNSISIALPDEVSTSTGYYSVDTRTLSRKLNISLRGSVTADISPAKVMLNPVTTLWEKTPYSFVVDWFINIGQWMNAMNFLALASKYEASKGYKIEMIYTSERHITLSPDPGDYTDRNWYSRQDGRVLLTERIPTRLLYHPQPKIHLDTFKVFDLIALGNNLRNQGDRTWRL